MSRNVFSAIAAACLICAAATAQDEGVPTPELSYQYEPNPAFPHGRPNPDAPEELSQFAFFVGEFDCLDHILRPDGEMQGFPAIWNGNYVLNGFAIQDHYWAPGFYTSNMRIFDPADDEWKVTYFSMPRYGAGTWTGSAMGDDIVLQQESTTPDGQSSISRLTFYEITDGGFRWRSETIVEGGDPTTTWTSDCTRRR